MRLILCAIVCISLSCSSKRWESNHPSEAAPKIEKKPVAELEDNIQAYMKTKGLKDSLCVRGLLEALHDYDCERIEIDWLQSTTLVTCLIRVNKERDTYWKRHQFAITDPVLLPGSMKRINIHRGPTICIDPIQKIDAVKFERSQIERFKIQDK